MLLILAITIVLAGKKAKDHSKKEAKDHSKKEYYFKPQQRTKDGSRVRSMCALNTINNIMQNNEVTENTMRKAAEKLETKVKAILGNENEFSFYTRGEGDFHVQVIIQVLEQYGYHILYTDEKKPLSEYLSNGDLVGFVRCNNNSHWFCYRLVNGQWYEMNENPFDSKCRPIDLSELELIFPYDASKITMLEVKKKSKQSKSSELEPCREAEGSNEQPSSEDILQKTEENFNKNKKSFEKLLDIVRSHNNDDLSMTKRYFQKLDELHEKAEAIQREFISTQRRFCRPQHIQDFCDDLKKRIKKCADDLKACKHESFRGTYMNLFRKSFSDVEDIRISGVYACRISFGTIQERKTHILKVLQESKRNASNIRDELLPIAEEILNKLEDLDDDVRELQKVREKFEQIVSDSLTHWALVEERMQADE